ncbi:hypothetical protein ACJX0J_026393, partial [Zea mays]
AYSYQTTFRPHIEDSLGEIHAARRSSITPSGAFLGLRADQRPSCYPSGLSSARRFGDKTTAVGKQDSTRNNSP